MNCKDCKYRDNDGYCQSDKIDEDYGLSVEEKADMLLYDYMEGGAFWVGEDFGCVHFESNSLRSKAV